MSRSLFSCLILILLAACQTSKDHTKEFKANAVTPSEELLAYQQMEVIGFIHFTINTFTDKEWGYGDESPELFNPSQLDVEQWVITAKEAGFKQLILTAKHHDGFCLWPSQYTEHSIKNSPYKNGKGDVVAEFTAACQKHGLKVGLYLSPWDRNHKDYGYPSYINYYKKQIEELLTQYGPVNEIWFDGANGGDGYYGGTYEKRHIDPASYYGWDSIFAYVKELQAHIKIFSDAGPDVHWIGNEYGFAGSTFWTTINTDSLVIGKSDTRYLNTGDPHGEHWVVGQCDVSIRPGWFYHQSQDSLVKTPQQLVDIYYKSVGRNALLLLNLPPDQRGIIHEIDVAALSTFKQIIDETFANNLALGAEANANNYRMKHKKFGPQHVLDEDLNTYWATDDAVFPATLNLKLPKAVSFDRILLQEPIHLGQRVSEFRLEIKGSQGWETVFQGTTIGYKRILRIKPVHSDQIRLSITQANNTVALANFGLYLSSNRESIVKPIMD